MTVQNGAGVNATCQATVTVNVPTLADFSLSSSPASVSVPANGSASVQIAANVVGQGATNYTVALSLGTLPQGVTGSFGQASLSPGQSTMLTLAAQKTAPLASNIAVTVTGTRTSDNLAHGTQFSLTVTRITLGNGLVSFTPTNTNVPGGVWSAASITCFNNLIAVAQPKIEAVRGKGSDTVSVAVRVIPNAGGGSYNHAINELFMSSYPDDNGVCGASANSAWPVLFLIEANHAYSDGVSDLFNAAASTPDFPAYGEVSLSRAVAVAIAHELQRKNLWNAAGGGVGVTVAGDSFNDMGATVLGGARAEGTFGGPAENAVWSDTATADLLMLHLAESACIADEAVADWEENCSFIRRFLARLYALINTEQRLYTEQEYFAAIAAESTAAATVDGLAPAAWYAGRSATFAAGTPGTYLGVAVTPRIVLQGSSSPFTAVLLATTEGSDLKKTAITSGSAKVEVLDVDGVTVFSTTQNLGVSHEVSVPATGLAAGGYTARATFTDQNGNPFVGSDGKAVGPKTNVFTVVPQQFYWDFKNFPGTYVIAITRDASGNPFAARSNFDTTPTWSQNGAALVNFPCNMANPCSGRVNGATISVPLPLPRVTAVPKI
jgi:hypothetical protein